MQHTEYLVSCFYVCVSSLVFWVTFLGAVIIARFIASVMSHIGLGVHVYFVRPV